MTGAIEAAVRAHAFFRGLADGDVALLAGLAAPARFVAGDTIFRTGDGAGRFYAIERGQVALDLFSSARLHVTIATLGPGDILGWSWLLPPFKKQFDARAVEATEALAFDGVRLREACERDPRLGYELLKRFVRVIGERLQATRLQILDVYGQP
jgi:CRP-like cAMP-binding protein